MELNLRVKPDVAAIPAKLRHAVAAKLGIDNSRVKQVDILRRSIDARQKQVWVNLSVKPHVDRIEPQSDPEIPQFMPLPDNAPQAIVVGAGPAGLFAALTLIENGVRPIVLERGKDVDERRKDLARISRDNVINPDSNYSFGEGGAGAYSDGKLYTRSKKRGNVNRILNILYAHGAPRDILVDAHPHIGTNLLPEIIKSIRQTILRCGGKVYFNTRVEGLLLNECRDRVEGVKTEGGQEFHGPVILATGHSARDVYRFLYDAGISLEPKGIAVGVRLEHPAELIDRLQYHSPEGRGLFLPAAEYSMLTRVNDRAVYSFCMCPGGVVVPATTAAGLHVVNGMSGANRGGRWSNAGMVTEVLPDDVEGDDPLRMMKFQESIEKKFFDDGDGTQNAPAQRMLDFVTGTPSSTLPPTSYSPGIHAARIDRLLPQDIASRLRQGFKIFGDKQKGFLTNDAALIGAETRTSAPVRIPRNPETMQHTRIVGLFPAGEGAGYAGGIVSAAIDGENVAKAVKLFITE